MTPSFEDDLRILAAGEAATENDLIHAALRVKTEMLVTSGIPTEAEMAAFVDLVAAVADRVDDATAESVARRLASWPWTPAHVRALLFHRGGRVAAALLTGTSPVPDGVSLAELAIQAHIEIARAVAGRADLTDDICLALVARDDVGIDRALAGNIGIDLPRAGMDVLVDRARFDPTGAALLLARTELAQTDVAPLYLHAPPERQALIRTALEAIEGLAATPRAGGLEPDEWQSLLAVAGSDAVAALAALAWRAGGGPTLASALVQDKTRQLTALALCALGTPVEDGTRFLIRLGDEAARSVGRVFAHVDLLRTVRPGVGVRLLLAVSADPLLRPSLGQTRGPLRHIPVMAAGGARDAAVDRAGPQRSLAGSVDRAVRRDRP